MHSTGVHHKCAVKLYRGLRELKNKAVSNTILIFHSNFRIWGFFGPYSHVIPQQAYLEESRICPSCQGVSRDLESCAQLRRFALTMFILK